jgi:predicted nucleotidyltransferase
MLSTKIDTETIYTIDEIKRRLFPVFRMNNVKKAVLFGSYANHTAHKRSDVDIIVDSGLRGLHFCGMAYDICAALAKKADVYDIRYLDEDSPLDAEIGQKGVIIFESE